MKTKIFSFSQSPQTGADQKAPRQDGAEGSAMDGGGTGRVNVVKNVVKTVEKPVVNSVRKFGGEGDLVHDEKCVGAEMNQVLEWTPGCDDDAILELSLEAERTFVVSELERELEDGKQRIHERFQLRDAARELLPKERGLLSIMLCLRAES